MKQDRKDTLYIVTGALLLLVAALLLNLAPAQEQPLLRVLPFLCLGVGAGLLGQGVGQQQIEVEDERNIQLAQRAKAKAFDLMIFVFGALLLAFALMQVDLTAILLLVGAYLLVQGYAVYCRVRLEKEM